MFSMLFACFCVIMAAITAYDGNTCLVVYFLLLAILNKLDDFGEGPWIKITITPEGK